MIKSTLLVVFGFILSIFLFSLFKNIQYPLIWADETETAMYAKRILQYGYPKLNDGKNNIWQTYLPDANIGINKKMDSCEALVWGQYYFAAIGEFFAEKTNDIYVKTAFLRIPFGVAGLIGLVIMAFSISGVFRKKTVQELIFFAAFFFLAICSVSLTLHLREVRHPSLEVFLAACIFYTYFNHRYYNKIKPVPYSIALTLLLFFLYHVFAVACFIFLAAIGLYEFIKLLKKRDPGDFFRRMIPLFAAFALIMPFFVLCHTMALGEAYRSFLRINDIPFWNRHVIGFFDIFKRYEFIYPVLAAKAIFLCFFAYFSMRRVGAWASIKQKMQISNFLSLFIITDVFMITFFPHPTIFERYYILIYPAMMMMLLIDIFGTLELFSQVFHASKRRWINGFYAVMLLLAFSINGHDGIDRLKNHAYELFHQYRGPMDFIMPFIKEQYKNPEDLVIATNYEELDYVYYLGSKVIVGFAGNTLDEDLKLRPDIIVIRKRFSFVDPAVFNRFLARDKYESFFFPVVDYFVNNIPDTAFHLYRTPLCNDENKCLSMLLRAENRNVKQ